MDATAKLVWLQSAQDAKLSKLLQETYTLCYTHQQIQNLDGLDQILDSVRAHYDRETVESNTCDVISRTCQLLLQCNEIQDFSWLDTNPFVNLRYLDLSNNKLADLPTAKALEQTPQIQMLLLHNNDIGIYANIVQLNHCSKLRHLTLFGNPIADFLPNYRQSIAKIAIQSILALDHYLVSDEEFVTGCKQTYWPYRPMDSALRVPFQILDDSTRSVRMSLRLRSSMMLQSPECSGTESDEIRTQRLPCATGESARFPESHEMKSNVSTTRNTSVTNEATIGSAEKPFKALKSDLTQEKCSEKRSFKGRSSLSIQKSQLTESCNRTIKQTVSQLSAWGTSNSQGNVAGNEFRDETCMILGKEVGVQKNNSSNNANRRATNRNSCNSTKAMNINHIFSECTSFSHQLDGHIKQLVIVRNFTSPAVFIQKTFRMYSVKSFTKRYSQLVGTAAVRLQKVVRRWALKFRMLKLEREFLLACAPYLALSASEQEHEKAATNIQLKWKSIRKDSNLNCSAQKIQKNWKRFHSQLRDAKQSLNGLNQLCCFDCRENRSTLYSAVSLIHSRYGASSLTVQWVRGVYATEPRVEHCNWHTPFDKYRSWNVLYRTGGGVHSHRLEVINEMIGENVSGKHRTKVCTIISANSNLGARALSLFVVVFRRKCIARHSQRSSRFAALFNPQAIEWLTAATTIQRVYRSHHLRKIFHVVKLYRKKNAAIVIQRWWKVQGFVARMTFVEQLSAYVAQLEDDQIEHGSEDQHYYDTNALYIEEAVWKQLEQLEQPNLQAASSKIRKQQCETGLKCSINSMGCLILCGSRTAVGSATTSLRELLIRKRIRLANGNDSNAKKLDGEICTNSSRNHSMNDVRRISVSRARSDSSRNNSMNDVRRISVSSARSESSNPANDHVLDPLSLAPWDSLGTESISHTQKRNSSGDKGQQVGIQKKSHSKPRHTSKPGDLRVGIPDWIRRAIGVRHQFEFTDDVVPKTRIATIKQVLTWGAKVQHVPSLVHDFGFREAGVQMVKCTYCSKEQAKLRGILCFCLSYSFAPLNVLAPLTQSMLREARIRFVVNERMKHETFGKPLYASENPWVNLPHTFSVSKYLYTHPSAPTATSTSWSRRQLHRCIILERQLIERGEPPISVNLSQGDHRLQQDDFKNSKGGETESVALYNTTNTASTELDMCDLGASGLGVLGTGVSTLALYTAKIGAAQVREKGLATEAAYADREALLNNHELVVARVSALKQIWVRKHKARVWKALVKNEQQEKLKQMIAENVVFREGIKQASIRAKANELRKLRDRVCQIRIQKKIDGIRNVCKAEQQNHQRDDEPVRQYQSMLEQQKTSNFPGIVDVPCIKVTEAGSRQNRHGNITRCSESRYHVRTLGNNIKGSQISKVRIRTDPTAERGTSVSRKHRNKGNVKVNDSIRAVKVNDSIRAVKVNDSIRASRLEQKMNTLHRKVRRDASRPKQARVKTGTASHRRFTAVVQGPNNEQRSQAAPHKLDLRTKPELLHTQERTLCSSADNQKLLDSSTGQGPLLDHNEASICIAHQVGETRGESIANKYGKMRRTQHKANNAQQLIAMQHKQIDYDDVINYLLTKTATSS